MEENWVKNLQKALKDFKCDINSILTDEDHDSEIKVGDFVKVVSFSDPRSEYVVAIGESDGDPVYCLEDGTFVCGENSVAKYKAQGTERMELMDRLNALY